MKKFIQSQMHFSLLLTLWEEKYSQKEIKWIYYWLWSTVTISQCSMSWVLDLALLQLQDYHLLIGKGHPCYLCTSLPQYILEFLSQNAWSIKEWNKIFLPLWALASGEMDTDHCLRSLSKITTLQQSIYVKDSWINSNTYIQVWNCAVSVTFLL